MVLTHVFAYNKIIYITVLLYPTRVFLVRKQGHRVRCKMPREGSARLDNAPPEVTRTLAGLLPESLSKETDRFAATDCKETG